jgi:AcrR family transcriptional regulator
MSAIVAPAGRPYGRRADAERNRETVLDHAARLLSEDPAAGMAEIAAESRIGRATLYRHFPTREALIEAITARALDDVERAFAASQLDEGSAREALRRLTAALLEIGDRYRFLLVQDTLLTGEERRRDLEAAFRGPILRLFERGRDGGEFSRSLSPSWMGAAFGGIIVAVAQEVAMGRMEQRDAERMVLDTLLHGLVEQAGPTAEG